MVIRHHSVFGISCYIDYLGMMGEGKKYKQRLDLYVVIAQINDVRVGAFHTDEFF